MIESCALLASVVYSAGIIVGWNPINLIEGEGTWVVHVAVVSLIASFLTVALYAVKQRCANLRTYKQGTAAYFSSPVIKVVCRSLYTPLLVLIWYMASIYCIDIVSDGLLSHIFSISYAVAAKIGVVVTCLWTLFRLKNGLLQLIVDRKVDLAAKIDPPTVHILSKLATIGIVFLALIFFYDITGMNMTTVLAFSGVGGLAFAFASQDIIANFFSGMMIQITRPFVVGEYISMPSLQLTGTIEEIGWYQTIVRPLDKSTLHVPNALFSKALLVNRSRMSHRPIDETIYVRVDPAKLLQLIDDIRNFLFSHEKIDAMERITVNISAIYGPAAKISIYACVQQMDYNQYCRVRDDLLVQIALLVQKHGGCLIPSPEANNGWLRIDCADWSSFNAAGKDVHR